MVELVAGKALRGDRDLSIAPMGIFAFAGRRAGSVAARGKELDPNRRTSRGSGETLTGESP